MGKVATHMDAVSYHEYKPRLREQILEVYRSLAAQGDCLLIIGRARPIERDLLSQEIMARAGTGTRDKARQPLYVVATMQVTKRSQKFFSAQQKELGQLSGHVEEMYTGHRVVKAFGK